MEDRRPIFTGWQRWIVAFVAMLVIAGGSLTAFKASTASAAASASLGVGCSASSVNGVLTANLRFRVAAASSGELTRVLLTSDGATLLDVDPVGSFFGPTTVVQPVAASDSFDIVLTVESTAGNATKTALATVTLGGGGVSCRVQSPAP